MKRTKNFGLLNCKKRRKNRPESKNTAKSNVKSQVIIEIIQDITKKRHQDLINEKIKQREELYAQQTFKMSQIKNNEVEKLNSQI